MPVVLREGPFTFFFYSNEGDPLEPIHIHVRAQGAAAKVWLRPMPVVATSRGFSARQLRVICGIVETNAELISRAWHEHFA